ncbi:MAG: transcriptional activator NhaR [Holophagaceae bacterium]
MIPFVFPEGAMEWLNYHHLLYFWTVAKAGSIARAGEKLLLAQPTISGQIKALEENLGEKLFERSGRHLQLTDMGRIVFQYADEIFALGRELQDTVHGRPTGRPLELEVGIADVLPKLVVYRLLEPATKLTETVRLVCREDKPGRLFTELSAQAFDLILSDAPLPPNSKVKAYNHLLGECGVLIFGTPELAKVHRKNFPQSLEGAPMLLPTEATMLRRSVDHWLERSNLRPRILGEFDDSALMMVFAQAGRGLVAAHAAVEREVRAQYGLVPLGPLPDVKERFYAISIERKLKHPAVIAISETARKELFA